MPTQHIPKLLGATCCVGLATVLRCVATCWVLLAQIWPFLNLSQQHSTCRNTSQHGGQTHTTCGAQHNMLCWHVAIVWPGLNSYDMHFILQLLRATVECLPIYNTMNICLLENTIPQLVHCITQWVWFWRDKTGDFKKYGQNFNLDNLLPGCKSSLRKKLYEKL